MKYLFIIGTIYCCVNAMVDNKKLSSYRKKRDFTQTPEPTSAQKVKKNDQLFVIQMHDASHLHYDFRLNIGGVLVSWAIPKGPSYNSKIKRLAARTEDHPLDYAYFEGVIPKGYGAGTVMVWDIGTYKKLEDKNLSQSLKDGKIEIFLEGKKLQGGFVLIRFKVEKSKEDWLLKKIDDAYASDKKNPVSTEKKSALTGRTMKQIEKDNKES